MGRAGAVHTSVAPTGSIPGVKCVLPDCAIEGRVCTLTNTKCVKVRFAMTGGPVAREGGAGLVTHFPVSINNFCITKDMYTINSSLDTSG